VYQKQKISSSPATIGTGAPYHYALLWKNLGSLFNPSKVIKKSIATRSKISPPLEAGMGSLLLLLTSSSKKLETFYDHCNFFFEKTA
jgi:hypothetical protein